ncbi:Cmgc mapk protein kinase [Globisporangium polare]
MSDSKPRILVLGGAGMIGRNFVKFCVDHDLVASIRVADKTMPEIAYFGQSHKDAFADARVTFVQADLTRDAHIERAFNPEFGPYDYVYNLAGETKCGLAEAVYASKCRDLSIKCATKAQAFGVQRYIEVSTALVYKSQAKAPASETAELQPWTLQARFKLEAEEEIRKLSGLDVVFVRPATVYGSADIMGLMPRIVCAAAYVKLKEKMKLLWDAEMRVNTVHVYDVCQALWHLSTVGKSGHVYNLVDKNDTNQEKLNVILEEVFRIKTGFIGKLISNLARVRMADVVDDANEKHMQPWADLCAQHGIHNTPLTPYIDKELLQHNHLYADGSKIEATGFTYKYPVLRTAEVRAVVEEMIAQKIFPPILT